MGSGGEPSGLNFVLDTHILLNWFDAGNPLSRDQQRIIRAANPAQPLWVSEISLWEIATLHELGRIRLQRPLQDWLESAVAPPLVRRIGISPMVASAVAELPENFHRDPADRIIVASTRIINATLLTRDRRIINAGIVPTVS